MTEPEPLTSPDCDCTDLDGFLLNVERLMASELVALSSHEVVAASLFLWCRAWKQRPAASLPNDDRVNAAFARLPLARFQKLRAEIMRGFVKCSDGRLYHRTLAEEAMKAFARKAAFRRKRDTDAERLRNWRATKGETGDETHSETQHETVNETRFVAEGQGRDREGKGKNNSLRSSRAQAIDLPDWLPKDAWEAFVAMRSKIKKPLMDLAKTRVLNKLEKLRGVGHDPRAVLEQSVFHCWQDVFEIKPNGAAATVLALETDAEIWDRKVGDFKRTGDKLWRSQDGAQPGNPDCMVPRAILEKHGYETGRRA